MRFNKKTFIAFSVIALINTFFYINISNGQDKEIYVTVTGDEADKVVFSQLMTDAAGVPITIDSNGKLIMESGGTSGFAQLLGQIVNHPIPINIRLTRSESRIFVGAWIGKSSSQVIDLDDIEHLPRNAQPGCFSRAGDLMHELWEKYEGRVNGREFEEAHEEARKRENSVMAGTTFQPCGETTYTAIVSGCRTYYIPTRTANGTDGYCAYKMLAGSSDRLDYVYFVTALPTDAIPLGDAALATDTSNIAMPVCGSVPSEGACCVDQQSCIYVTQETCDQYGGIFHGEGVACWEIQCSGSGETHIPANSVGGTIILVILFIATGYIFGRKKRYKLKSK